MFFPPCTSNIGVAFPTACFEVIYPALFCVLGNKKHVILILVDEITAQPCSDNTHLQKACALQDRLSLQS